MLRMNLHYFVLWGTSNFQTLKKNLLPITLSNISLRRVFRASISGIVIRIKFSNIVRATILKIQKAIISDLKAKGSSENGPSTSKTITFSGKEKININAGEDIYSDILKYSLKAFSEVAISIYFGIVTRTNWSRQFHPKFLYSRRK